jgi:shikimate kinase / 3-dehydroquinate synthase
VSDDQRQTIGRVLLIGFSGTGKSTTAQHVADAIGWSVLEMDDEIERREGMSIPNIFERHGETFFRKAEETLLREGLRRDRVVISTGGGAVCTEAAWEAIGSAPGTFVVAFEASPEEILRRVERHAQTASDGQTVTRPMLDSDNQLGRIRQLLCEREPFYRRADVIIPVDERPAERTAADITEMVRIAAGGRGEVALSAGSARSRILVAPGVREELTSHLVNRWPKARHVWLGVDQHVNAVHGDWVGSVESDGAFRTSRHVIPSGEGSKSLDGLGALYDWMIGGGVERTDVAVAVGGGVTGDLVGFAAATTLRGIGLVQVPTTLLSMVDSSVGGKTGINHSGGKNLIGAFYQPPLVLVDPHFLRTLPERELRSGFAEVIKHGVIQASTPGGEEGFLLRVLELNAGALQRLEEPLTSWIIRQNISLKASVVEADEKESHLRQILNFGHTIGHGIEAAGYALLHGEAVAVGMVAAMTIGVEMGLVDVAVKDRLVNLIASYGLPATASFDPDIVRGKMASDKKKRSGLQQWVLPAVAGGVEIRTDVDTVVVDRALDAVRA